MKLGFEKVGLDWTNYTNIEKGLFRPTDIEFSFANPDKARSTLNWSAKVKFKELINKLVECELNNQYI